MSQDKKDLIGATLLLERAAPIDYDLMVKRIGASLGITADAVKSLPGWGGMAFAVGNEPQSMDLVMGMAMETRYPADLSNIARFAHWWPTATADIANCQAHLMIMCSWSSLSRLDAHIRHMVLVRELVEQLPVIGVLWGSVLTPRDNFKGEFQLATQGQIPLLLWVLIQYTRQPNGNTLVSTVGMRDFGAMEIETESSLPMQETYDFVRMLAQHVIVNRPDIKDGDTVSLGEGGKPIYVRHTRSFRPDVNANVYWLELTDTPSVAKPKGIFNAMFGSQTRQ